VRETLGLAPWPVQVGGEFVHGAERCMALDELRAAGARTRELEWPDRTWEPGEPSADGGAPGPGRMLTGAEAEADPELAAVHRLFRETVGEGRRSPRPGRDVDGAELVRRAGFNARQTRFAEAVYANDFGCSLRDLGLGELRTECRAWAHGDAYVVPLDVSYLDLARTWAATPGVVVELGWPAARVEADAAAGIVVVTARDGRTCRAARAVVTVSLGVLKAGALAFAPPLSEAKRGAIARLGFGNAIKVLVSFADAAWPPDITDVVCPGATAPEVWFLRAPDLATPASRAAAGDLPGHLACFFLCGDRAREAQRLVSYGSEGGEGVDGGGEAAVVGRCLDQLDAMFPPSDTGRKSARALMRKYLVFDWSRDEHTRGCYSFPTHGARPGDRAALAAPAAGGRLFFAGEATHPGVNPCFQAAMETGVRAAAEVIASRDREEASSGGGKGEGDNHWRMIRAGLAAAALSGLAVAWRVGQGSRA